MRIKDSLCEGLKIIEGFSSFDYRGGFIKIFNDDEYKKAGLDVHIKETYYSVSNKNVIRGMHFQIPPYEHAKIVHIIKGAVEDVVLDLRKNSNTYGKTFSFILNDKTPVAIYIPIGLAHGFRSLEDNSIMLYQVTSVYNHECDTGILYNSIGFDWNVDYPIVSERDSSFIKFNDFTTPF